VWTVTAELLPLTLLKKREKMRTSLSQRRITSAGAASSSSMHNNYSSSSNSRRNIRRSRARNKQPSAHDDEDGFSTEESDYPTSPRIDRLNKNQLLPGMRDNNNGGTNSSGAEESDGGWSDESGKNSVTDLGGKLSSPVTSYPTSSSSSSSSPAAAAAASRQASASSVYASANKDYSRYDSEKPDPMEMDVSDDESFSHSALGTGSYLTKNKPSPNGGGGIGGGMGAYHHNNKSSLLDGPAMIETSPAVMSPPGRGGGPPRVLTTTSLVGLQAIGSPAGEQGLMNTRSVSPLGDDDDDDDDDDDMDRPPTILSPMHSARNNEISGPATGYFGYRHIESKGQPRQQPIIPPRPPTPEQQEYRSPVQQQQPMDPPSTTAVVVPHKYGLGAFSLTNSSSNNVNAGGGRPSPENPSNNNTSNGSDMQQQQQGVENNNDPRFGNGGVGGRQMSGFGPPPTRYSTDSEAGFRSVNDNNKNTMPSPLSPSSNVIKPGSTSSGSLDDDDIYVENEADNNNSNNKRVGSRRNMSSSPVAADTVDRSSTPATFADRRPRSPSPSPSASGSRTSRSRTPTSLFQDEGASSPGNGDRSGGGGIPPSPPGSPYGYDRDYNDFDDDRRSRSGSPPRDRNLPPIVVGGSRGGGSAASLDDYKTDEESRRSRTRRTTRSHDETATMSYSEREAKRNRKTITWLVIGLACALMSLAALAGGLFGALYFANDDNSGDDNASAPGTISPDDSPSEATVAPSSPSGGPLPNATFPDIPTQTPGGEEEATAAPLEPLEIANQALFDLVASASVDGGAAIMVNGSPQNMAYRWLQNEDTLTIAGGVSPSNSTGGGGSGGARRRHLRKQEQQQQQEHRQLLRNDRIIQRYAMACFYYGAGGPGWIRDGWLNGTVNECKWPIDTPSDINCDTESNMVSIEFKSNRLSGQLAPELGLLKKLVRLVIQNNETEPNLTGAIPTELQALKAMRFLEITGNAFTQPLPDNLFNSWKAAAVINFSNNGLPGAIPGSIGQLRNCTQFIASKNRLTGDIPKSIVNMTSLKEWDISENNITGSVTSEMCVALTTVPTKAIVDCNKVTCDCCEPCGEDSGVGVRP
jgi:hypothetical protein